MSDLLYTVFTRIEPEYEEDFRRFQEEEHCPLLLTCPGFQSVTRYQCLDIEHYHVNFWHIDDKKYFDAPERKEKAMNTPWGKRLSPYRHRHIDFYCQDGGLSENASFAEIDSRLTHLVIDTYSDLNDTTLDLTKQYRSVLDAVKGCSGVLDAKIYHSYEGLGTADNYVFYYLSCTGQELESLVLPQIREITGFAEHTVLRNRFVCTSQWKPKGK